MDKTTISRRAVLGGAAMAAVAAATGGLGGSASAATAAGQTSPYPGLKAFERLVGTVFTVRASSVLSSVTLTSVTPLAMTGLPRSSTMGGVRTTGEQFSLLFSGAASSSFPQGTYTLSTKSLGGFDLFIVPVGPPAAQQQYQAVIVSV